MYCIILYNELDKVKYYQNYLLVPSIKSLSSECK